FGKNSGATVALPGPRRVPVFFVLRQVNDCLPLLCLGFLQTQYVGIVLCNKFLKLTFSNNGSDAVYIPGIDLHICQYSLVIDFSARLGGNVQTNTIKAIWRAACW